MLSKTVLPVLLAGASVLFAIAAHAGHDPDQKVFGWIEKAELEPSGVEVKAKFDTGALTSSLQAEHIERFKKNGEEWVRFVSRVEAEDQDDKLVSLKYELPVFRNVIIISAAGRQRRPVVLMTACIGDVYYQIQVSLEDRDKFTYPFLIGRRAIQHMGLIDVTRTFLHQPGCTEDSRVSLESERENDEDIGI